MAFVHLHSHTQYSIQDAVNKIDDYLARVKELGQTACAITDHGNMYGILQFYKKATAMGIKPIIGCEVYLTDGDHKVREDAKYAKYYHLILLAENQTGYQNLVKLVTLSYTEGFYRRPRVDYELLEKYHEGIICLSACIAGELPKAILRNDMEAARTIIRRNVEIFGEGNYFLEIQDHGIPEERRVQQALVMLSREMNVPLVATNDVHYTKAEDRQIHDALLCIRSNSNHTSEAPILLNDTTDPRRISYNGDGYYVKSEEEMRKLFPSLNDAIENTQKIADRCNVEFEFHKTKMPAFELPEGHTAYSYLKELCMEGIPKRYPGREEEIIPKMDYELGVIQKMGFLEYILIVWDFINWAKTHDVPVGPGRGSAAGSIVCYLIGITDIDPLKYDLLFQRFLNPERVSMPDIDVDFCKKNRYKVVDYVKEKYGEDCVCQIVTFGTFAARQAIKDAGRCLGLSVAERDAFAKLVPEAPDMTLKLAKEQSSEFAEACSQYPRVYEIASSIEGLPRQTGTHAAGVIICDRPVSDYIPLSVNGGVVQSQFNMSEVEELGLLKMDFLGLRTLTSITEAEKNIKSEYGEIPPMEEDDPKVYEMIASGKSSGVFQLESQGMQDFMKELKPTCIDDLIAGVALYRPGPMDFIPDFVKGKANAATVHYECPQLEPILKNTYGCIVYQEQVMQIFQALAGYSLGRADIVRRAMSKKKASVLEAEREVFIHGDEKAGVPGCVKNGISEESAIKIFQSMEDFASYAFNKSHAAAYATLCYRTAWLMTYYPTEYFAALMTSVVDNSEKVAIYAQAAREKGISLSPVDIDRSGSGFVPVENGKILFALSGISGIGEQAAEEFCRIRIERNGPDGKFPTFRKAVEACREAGISSKGVSSLANAGAFERFGGTRKQYATIAKEAMSAIANEQKNKMPGQMSLFEAFGLDEPDFDLPDTGEYPFLEKCEVEKKALRMYVTARPLDGFFTFRQALANKFPEFQIGLLKSIKRYEGKNGPMAFLSIELDDGEEHDFVVFPNVYREKWSVFQEGTILIFRCGRDNIINDVETPRDYPVNVWLRCSKEDTHTFMTRYKNLAQEYMQTHTEFSGAQDALRVFVTKQERYDVIHGYFKEEDFLNVLREDLGAENVVLLLAHPGKGAFRY